jgi:hypothetical protein
MIIAVFSSKGFVIAERTERAERAERGREGEEKATRRRREGDEKARGVAHSDGLVMAKKSHPHVGGICGWDDISSMTYGGIIH